MASVGVNDKNLGESMEMEEYEEMMIVIYSMVAGELPIPTLIA